jgi:hypothetical protein
MAIATNYRQRLGMCVACLGAMILGIAATAWLSISRLSVEMETTAGPAARQLEIAGSMRSGFEQMNADARAAQVALVIQLLEKGSKREGECGGCHTMDMAAEQRRRADGAARELERQMGELERLQTTPEGRSSLAALRGALDRWRAGFGEYLELAGRAETYDKAHEVLTGTVHPALVAGKKATGELSHSAQRVMAAAQKSGRESASGAGLILMVAGAATGIACVLVFLLMSKMTRRLASVAEALNSAASNVIGSTHKLAFSSQELSRSAASQESAFEETMRESEGVLSAARENNRGASEAARAGQSAEGEAAGAQGALEAASSAMELIHQSSLEIRGVMTLIDSIAFQTNLLALNASVEAARAGESGQGFAVVAEEVRNLAQRSAEAARQTSGIIELLIARTREGGSRLELAAKSLEGIRQHSRNVHALMQRLNTSSAGQVEGLSRLNQAIASAGASTQQASRTAEESAAEAEELTQTSDSLRECVESLAQMMGIRAR